MLYDDSQSPDERFAATLMPLPADSDYTKEQGHISIIAMKKNFAIEYETLDHPALLRDQHIERWCRGSSFPSLHAFYSAAEELKMMEVLRRTGRSASAEAQPPKGSTAELMLREATSEVVFSGAEYLYREPRCVTRCAKMLLGKWVVDVSHVPTRSKPESFATKLPTSFSKTLSKARARRDCEAAMKDILKAWREEHTGNKSKRSNAKHDESSHKSSRPKGHEEDRGDSGKFVDAHFFLGHRSSLYPTGTAPDTHVPEPRDLVSLCSLYPHVELFPQEYERDGPPSSCGAAEDCEAQHQEQQFIIPVCRSTHLVAAACAVASMKNGFEFLREVFVTPQLGDEEDQGEADAEAKPYDDRHTNKGAEGGEGLTPTEFLRRYGFIGVLLYVNASWEWVIIDDLIPTDATGASPLMMHLVSRGHMESLQSMFGPFSKDAAVRGRLGARVSTRVPTLLDGRDDPSALWPHMLQKAAAKWFGAYDAVDGGSPRNAMEMLTGGSVSSLRPLEEDSMAAFDAFDDETSGRLCLVYCTRELFVGLGSSSVCKGVLGPQRSRKSEAGGRAFDRDPRTDSKSGNSSNTLRRRERPTVDEETDTFRYVPSRGGKEGSAVWLPRHLPLILSRCYTSEDKATPVVRLQSPWGMLGPGGSSTVDLEWSEFVTICDHCDLCTLPDASQVYAEAYGVSAPNVARSFSFALRAPLRAPITVCVRQADPRSHFDLPYEVRRRLPLVGMSMSIKEVISKSLVYQSSEPVVALENSVDLRLLPGEYTVTLQFDEAPSVPFLLRVCASTLVTVKLWPTGLHPDVSGATTARISNTPVNGGGRRDRDAAASERLKRLLKARQSPVVTEEDLRRDYEGQEARRSESLSPSARAAEVLAKKVFDEVDILERGTLDLRSAERAAAEYFFAHTREGRALRDALTTQAANGGGVVNKEAFAPLMSTHFRDHFAN